MSSSKLGGGIERSLLVILYYATLSVVCTFVEQRELLNKRYANVVGSLYWEFYERLARLRCGYLECLFLSVCDMFTLAHIYSF
jgi:hypothetical protein